MINFVFNMGIPYNDRVCACLRPIDDVIIGASNIIFITIHSTTFFFTIYYHKVVAANDGSCSGSLNIKFYVRNDLRRTGLLKTSIEETIRDGRLALDIGRSFERSVVRAGRMRRAGRRP